MRAGTVVSLLIAVVALGVAAGALGYAVTRHPASTGSVRTLRQEVASLEGRVAELRQSNSLTQAVAAGQLSSLPQLRTTVNCLEKWQNKIRGVQPSFLVPANGYPDDDYMMTLTGVFEQC